MIIDAHTHIYPASVAGKALRTVISNTNDRLTAYTNGTFPELTASMNEAGIDYSIVLPVATSPGQGFGILRWIEDLSPSSPHLFFFGSVHPEDSDYRDCIREMAGFGLQGVKFHPAYQHFPVDSKKARAVYEEALKNNLTLYFHSGFDMSMPDSDCAAVERFAVLLEDFRGCKIVLAHGGGYGEWARVLDLLGDKKCYYDIAFTLEEMMASNDAKELYRRNEDYFLFGTDSPWRSQKKYVELIRNSDILTGEQKEKLFSGNILKLITIDRLTGGNNRQRV